MANSAAVRVESRRIENFVLPAPKTPASSGESPDFLGHLMVMPLTDSKKAYIDPDSIISVSEHRQQNDVTVIRLEGDSYVYFIDRPIEVVQRWLGSAFEEPSDAAEK